MLPGSLTLEITNATVCFNKAVRLRCQHQVLPSGMFATARPSWKEDGVVLAIDGGMYRSVTWINETHTVLELVPEQSRFEPSGAHNYTCFLPLVEGGELESNPVEVRPQGVEYDTHIHNIGHKCLQCALYSGPCLRRSLC